MLLSRFRRSPADQLARAIHNHKTRSPASDLLFAQLSPEALTTPKSVCLALASLARRVYTSEALQTSLISRFAAFPAHSLNEQDIGLFCNACVRLGVRPGNLHELIHASAAKAELFRPQGLSNLFHALSRWGLPLPLDAVQPLITACASADFSAPQFANVLQALAKLNLRPPDEFVKKAASAVSDPQGCSMILDAVAKLEVSTISIETLLAGVLGGGEQELGVALNACAKLKIRHEPFLQSWTDQCKPDQLSVLSLSNAALALARLDWPSPVDAILAELTKRDMPYTQHVGQALFACAACQLPSHSALFLNKLPTCSDLPHCTFALEAQVISAVLACADHPGFIESISIDTLQLLRGFKILSDGACDAATLESDAKSSRFHHNVKKTLSAVVPSYSISEEVFQMPYFIDLVVS